LNDKQWVIVSLIVFSVGAAFLVINFLVFVPKFQAFSQAALAWAQDLSHSSTMPSLEAYQLSANGIILFQVLGTAGYLLVFIGLIHPVILLASKVAKKFNRIE
jgi:hypothetical protein